MSDITITVIGGGASSISFIDAFLEGIARHELHQKTISIFMLEKSVHLGRGLAYSDDCVTNLLNTKASFISPFIDKPGHFYEWLQNNKDIWEDDFPGVNLHPDAFLPRSLFGCYLSNMLQHLGRRAIKLGCRLITIHDEATKISSSHDKRIVSTKGNISFSSDYVVLSCGNGNSLAYKHLSEIPGFFPSPYPIKRITRLIGAQDRIAIIGSRLSAIDAVIGLVAAGHSGPITMHSRGGELPAVRGSQKRYNAQYLVPKKIRNHIAIEKNFRLDDLIDWTLKEIQAAGEIIPDNLSEIIKKCEQNDPLEHLLKEIEAARNPRPWQAVLYAMNEVIDLIWPSMPNEDKERFWPYLSLWMTYRVSIPIENAIKLTELLKSGQLTVIPGMADIGHHNQGFFVDTKRDNVMQRYEYEAVILATGTPRNVYQLDNPLIQNILKQKTAVPCQFGGLCVSSKSGALISPSGYIDERITVLGELTNGTFFFTSALEINARHARDRADFILKNLIHSNSRPEAG